MKPDEFEKELIAQPRRPVPPAWRAEILAAAHAAGKVRVGSPSAGAKAGSPPAPWWKEWLWPCPQAWAGLAAVWVLIAWLQASPPGEPVAFAGSKTAPTPATALSLPRAELARLLDNVPEPVPAPKPAPAGPRSDCRPRSPALDGWSHQG